MLHEISNENKSIHFAYSVSLLHATNILFVDEDPALRITETKINILLIKSF